MPDVPTPLDLDAIVAAIAACRTYNFGMYQADRLAHEHAPALVEEVKRLRAEVARPAPAWDEEAVRGAFIDARLASALEVMADGYPSVCIRSNEDAADAALAVVREHLPAKPSRETIARAILNRYSSFDLLSAYGIADVVLDLLPGRSEAEVKAEAWDKAVDTLSRHGEDVAPAAVADLERRNPYRGSSDCGCDLTGMVPPAVHIVDNHEGGAS